MYAAAGAGWFRMIQIWLIWVSGVWRCVPGMLKCNNKSRWSQQNFNWFIILFLFWKLTQSWPQFSLVALNWFSLWKQTEGVFVCRFIFIIIINMIFLLVNQICVFLKVFNRIVCLENLWKYAVGGFRTDTVFPAMIDLWYRMAWRAFIFVQWKIPPEGRSVSHKFVLS